MMKINTGAVFELAALTSYKDFLQIPVVHHVCFLYFNLFPPSTIIRLAWKQHVLLVPYGAEFEVPKFLSYGILQNLI